MVQQADRVLGVIIAAEGVGTDHFGQALALMRRGGAPAAAHFGQTHAHPALRQLPRRLASGQTAADNVHLMGHSPRR